MTTNLKDNIALAIQIIILLGLTKICSILVGKTILALFLAVILYVTILTIIILIANLTKKE